MSHSALKRSCPVCDAATGNVLHHQTFALNPGHPLAGGYDVVTCQQCGFAFADTSATQADYDHYYATQSKYADSSTSTGAGVSPWDAARLRETAECIASFCSTPSARIVDIGCANGGLLAALKHAGFENIAGIDPSPSCARETEKLTGARAFPGSIFGLPSEVAGSDGAILSHVMEHVRDLRPALAAVREILSEDGWLYVEVPDATRYREFLFAPFQDFNTEHINHFSLRTLSNLLQVSGFVPEQSGQKVIYSWKDMPYPAAWIIARRSDKSVAIAPDADLATDLREYIDLSHAYMRHLAETITSTLAVHPEIYVWGTGQLTLKLLNETSLGQANIRAFIDSSPIHQGNTLRGHAVIPPAEATNRACPILIASIINQASIQQSIARLGLQNPVVTLVPKPEPFTAAA